MCCFPNDVSNYVQPHSNTYAHRHHSFIFLSRFIFKQMSKICWPPRNFWWPVETEFSIFGWLYSLLWISKKCPISTYCNRSFSTIYIHTVDLILTVQKQIKSTKRNKKEKKKERRKKKEIRFSSNYHLIKWKKVTVKISFIFCDICFFFLLYTVNSVFLFYAPVVRQ